MWHFVMLPARNTETFVVNTRRTAHRRLTAPIHLECTNTNISLFRFIVHCIETYDQTAVNVKCQLFWIWPFWTEAELGIRKWFF